MNLVPEKLIVRKRLRPFRRIQTSKPCRISTVISKFWHRRLKVLLTRHFFMVSLRREELELVSTDYLRLSVIKWRELATTNPTCLSDLTTIEGSFPCMVDLLSYLLRFLPCSGHLSHANLKMTKMKILICRSKKNTRAGHYFVLIGSSSLHLTPSSTGGLTQLCSNQVAALPCVTFIWSSTEKNLMYYLYLIH